MGAFEHRPAAMPGADVTQRKGRYSEAAASPGSNAGRGLGNITQACRCGSDGSIARSSNAGRGLKHHVAGIRRQAWHRPAAMPGAD